MFLGCPQSATSIAVGGASQSRRTKHSPSVVFEGSRISAPAPQQPHDLQESPHRQQCNIVYLAATNGSTLTQSTNQKTLGCVPEHTNKWRSRNLTPSSGSQPKHAAQLVHRRNSISGGYTAALLGTQFVQSPKDDGRTINGVGHTAGKGRRCTVICMF